MKLRILKWKGWVGVPRGPSVITKSLLEGSWSQRYEKGRRSQSDETSAESHQPRPAETSRSWER